MTFDWTIANEHQFDLHELRLYRRSGVDVNITTVLVLSDQAFAPAGFGVLVVQNRALKFLKDLELRLGSG